MHDFIDGPAGGAGAGAGAGGARRRDDLGRPGPWGRRRGPRPFAKFEDFGSPGWGGHGPGHMHGHDHGHGRLHDGPPWRPGRRMRRGDIRLALLLELTHGPAHGYELIGRLESRTGGMWRPSAGSVYPTLQLLEDEGLVRGSDEGGKRVFELTEEGRSEADAVSERVGQGGPWAGPPTGFHFELRKGMRTLMLAARQVAVAGDEGQVAAAVAVINEARQRIYRILAGEGGGAGEASGADEASDTAATGDGPPPGDPGQSPH
ncbi:MAG TPA: PadR family transcriptional regulator [Acidimicrobiales bacterium]|nr:PadR family transcriptional regulator [Acidimicrobiales bacterium]